jgi:hypothetical protein
MTPVNFEENKRHVIRTIAVFALVSLLLLLLIPQTSGSHAPQLLWFVLVPIFLFAGLDTGKSLPLPVRAGYPGEYRQPERSALFQRPPPSA